MCLTFHFIICCVNINAIIYVERIHQRKNTKLNEIFSDAFDNGGEDMNKNDGITKKDS